MASGNNILVVGKLSSAKETELKRHLKRRIMAIKDGLKGLYEDKLPKLRAAYEAKPREEVRMFPFQNASNLVIPIIGIHTDTLHARVMSGIFKTYPLYVSKIFGEFDKNQSDLKDAYEEFMQYVGIEPQELDLYRVYNEWSLESIKLGTSTVKAPWEQIFRHFYIPLSTGESTLSGAAKDFIKETTYEGPRPEKLPFDAFGIPATAKTIEQADIKYHRRVMLRHEIEQRIFEEMYDKTEAEEVLKSADRHSPTPQQEQNLQSANVTVTASYGHEEWDIYECYLQWRYDQDPFAPRMIVTYHLKTDRILRVMYDNFKEEWFVSARMAHRDDMYHGMGFAELLWYFQEEASQKHNGRNDNQTIANTRVWRVHPDSKLHNGYRVYPGAMLPADEGEIEPLVHGEISSTNMDEERLTLELAERRSGVSPPQQGFGAGTMSGKRGVYSAMGTLSLLQEGNRRSDLNISDMRDSHTRLGRVVSLQYHVLGKDSDFHKKRLSLFGKKAELIAKALGLIADRKMALPVYAATASVNKEVEKQNDIMLSQIIMRHYQAISSLLAQLQMGNVPPLVKQYAVEVCGAANSLMKGILRNFGHDDVEKLIPDTDKLLAAASQQAGGQNGQQPQPNQGANPQGQNPPQPNANPPMAQLPPGSPIQ
jgi:hypothetical protein